MIDDEADQIPKPEGMLSLELKQKRLQAEGKDLYGREAYELQFLSIRWIDKKMIRERQKKREAQLALRERWKNSVKVDEKKAETFLEKVKKRLLRLILGEKAVSRSMKGKGDPAFERRMRVLNLARTYVQRRPRIATNFEKKTTIHHLSWRRSHGDASRHTETAASRETAAGASSSWTPTTAARCRGTRS